MNDKKEYCCPTCKKKTIKANGRLAAMTEVITCPNCGVALTDNISIEMTSYIMLLIIIICKAIFPNIHNLWFSTMFTILFIPGIMLASKIIPMVEHRHFRGE